MGRWEGVLEGKKTERGKLNRVYWKRLRRGERVRGEQWDDDSDQHDVGGGEMGGNTGKSEGEGRQRGYTEEGL